MALARPAFGGSCGNQLNCQLATWMHTTSLNFYMSMPRTSMAVGLLVAHEQKISGTISSNGIDNMLYNVALLKIVCLHRSYLLWRYALTAVAQLS